MRTILGGRGATLTGTCGRHCIRMQNFGSVRRRRKYFRIRNGQGRAGYGKEELPHPVRRRQQPAALLLLLLLLESTACGQIASVLWHYSVCPVSPPRSRRLVVLQPGIQASALLHWPNSSDTTKPPRISPRPEGKDAELLAWQTPGYINARHPIFRCGEVSDTTQILGLSTKSALAAASSKAPEQPPFPNPSTSRDHCH